MMQIGTLVRYHHDGDFGLITEIMDEDTGYFTYWIKWTDGTEGDYLPTEFEVIA